MVLAAGATQWTKLGDLAGLDEDGGGEESSDEASSAPSQAAAPTVDEDEPQYIPQRPLPIAAQPVQAVQPVVQQTVRMTQPMPQRVQAVQPAPVVQQTVRMTQSAYVAPRESFAPSSNANSLRPMSMDLGDAADYDMPFKKKSRKGWAVAVLGVLAIAGGTSVAANRGHLSLKSLGIGGSSSDLSSAAAAAAAQPPPPPVEAPPPPAAAPPPPPPVMAAAAQTFPVEASPLNPNFTTSLNDTGKAKLVAADKGSKTKGARHAAPASHGGGGSKAKSGAPFSTGGNKFDPLNSSI
jgi:hypothetical protein